MEKPTPLAFLASRMDPKHERLWNLRREIHELGVRSGREIWVAEHSERGLKNRSAEEVQATCLQCARAADEFIAIVDGSYGTPWNFAEVCVLELELLTAALSGKPFHLFILKPYEPDPRIESLLRALRLARRDLVDVEPRSDRAILSELTRQFGRIHTDRGRERWPRRQMTVRGDLDLRFLDGHFMPLHPEPPAEHLIRDLLRNVASSSNEATRLVNTWMALRHLCAAPYSDPAFAAYLPLWDTALSRWASAAAWYGLHGHHYLGRLAAVNTLVWIRQQPGFRTGTGGKELAIQGTYGGLASEYYSIAKLTATRRERRALLERALTTVNRAFDGAPPDPSGLYGIRASILQALGRRRQGLRDYRRMVEIRITRGEDDGRIGEAEAELGMGYLRLGRIDRAGYYLTRGVSKLERSERQPFTVRALQKLAIFYLVTLRIRRSRETLRRAGAVAQEYEIRGQLSQIETLLHRLDLLDWRVWLRVRRTNRRARRKDRGRPQTGV